MSEKRGYVGLVLAFADAEFRVDRTAEMAIGARLQAKIDARKREVDDLIRMGYGDVNPAKIPANWRERRGRDRALSPEHIAAIREGRRRQLAAKTGQSADETTPSRENVPAGALENARL